MCGNFTLGTVYLRECSCFFGQSGFVLVCQDWQSPENDNLKENKQFYTKKFMGLPWL